MKQNEQWSSKIGFILAAAGSAIGLGAIWKFPYIAGTGGGGAFFLVFLVFALLIGYPLLVGEFIVGRKGQDNAVSIYKKMAPNSMWPLLGRAGVLIGILVLSFYSVIGGWIILYLCEALTGGLNGLSIHEYGVLFEEIISDPLATLVGQFVFITLTVMVVAKGVQKGIEKVSKILMPVLFGLFIIVVIRSLTLDGAAEGVKFLLVPDFGQLTSESILFALGQAFFTISLGSSVMVTYASYLPRSQNLPRSAFLIIAMNLFVCLLAGLAIFPGVFSFGIEPNAGPPLVFIALAAVFAQMEFGVFFFSSFLILFLFAALTSAFSMIEIAVSVTAKQDPVKRQKYTWMFGLLIFLIGIPSALSYGIMEDVKLWDKTFFDLVDYAASNVLMPLGAFFTSFFISLKIKKSDLLREMKQGADVSLPLFHTWYFLVKYAAPAAIVVVFLDVLGVLF
ncbi:sodium-dependent transporter [Cytobacillus gottheilii]|uniref:sodium-dependent transporter n=1 Tax=Cytobacillus gottheilii TaxID=859144 RepID=UPI0009BBD4E9|nr:sodium-dependent transporter [Cytobacillus gottheilii]